MTSKSPALDIGGTASDIDRLLDPASIKRASFRMLESCKSGGTHFKLDLGKLDAVADKTAAVTRKNYPNIDTIPYHSRWSHFQYGNVDRNSKLKSLLSSLPMQEQARSKMDLVVMSVLVDAGAGDRWTFEEKDSGVKTGRSEGLALASWHLFIKGLCSSDSLHPYRTDARALACLDSKKWIDACQISDSNSMMGFEGRLVLMKNLGAALENTKYFPESRVGSLLDYVRQQATGKTVAASTLLRALQDSLGSIWPGRVSINGFNLGDVWHYAPWGNGLDAFVPFHKLSQWLTYSIVEPCQDFGMTVDRFDGLSGLAEYRNGGLFVDMGVLQPRHASLLATKHEVGSEVVVEWRSLTLALLEELAPKVRALLGRDLPLGKILEGGTWWAGREVAKAARPAGGPPLQVLSDGTVF